MRDGKDRVDTPAATNALVEQLDAYQYELREGPCLDAVFVDDSYTIKNMSTEDRWPNWAPRAAALGVMSSLSIRLVAPRGSLGALNLYAEALHAFDDEDVLAAHIFARHASIAITSTQEVEGQATAVLTRHSIGMAQGLLMQRYGLTAERSLRFLARVSQDNNIKLRDVAGKVVGEAEGNGGHLP
jgi:GAF domain-containing protein